MCIDNRQKRKLCKAKKGFESKFYSSFDQFSLFRHNFVALVQPEASSKWIMIQETLAMQEILVKLFFFGWTTAKDSSSFWSLLGPFQQLEDILTNSGLLWVTAHNKALSCLQMTKEKLVLHSTVKYFLLRFL